MKPSTIGIIGVNGKYGKWLKRFFEQHAYLVIGSDITTSITNQQVVQQSDVVIFSVPIEKVVSIIDCVNEFSRADQLFMDVTSIKTPAIDAMLRSRASVVGLHPMCAPSGETLRGQVIVRCDARLDDTWREWVVSILEATHATIKESAPEEHDRYMAAIQGLPHAAQLVMARVICNLNVDVPESMTYTSPFYKIAFGLMGRILSKNASMYASIQMENTLVLKVLVAFEREIKRFRKIIETKDDATFRSDFEASVGHFGKESIMKADKFFDDVIGLMSDFSEENMFVLETETDKPGIAHDLTGIFAEANVNLTSFHSQKTKGGQFRFLVGFDKLKGSSEIKTVVARINEMSYLKIVS